MCFKGLIVCRIRDARNQLNHVSKNQLTYEEFLRMWNDLTPSLRRLGCSEQRLEYLKTADLDPLSTRMCEQQVWEQTREEQELQMQVCICQTKFTVSHCNSNFVFFLSLDVCVYILQICGRYSSKSPSPCPLADVLLSIRDSQNLRYKTVKRI